jgi:opacity protein-like surface antigen
MKRRIPALTLAVLVAVALPASAQYRHRAYRGGDNEVRFSAGLFTPDGSSRYWNDSFFDFSGDIGDFEDAVVDFDYLRRLGGNLKLIATVSGYEGKVDQAYRRYQDDRGRDIFHTTTLDVSTATIGLLAELAGRQSPVVPYLGAGGGLYVWTLKESGDFIDFGTDPLEIFSDRFRDDGVTTGWFWLAGLDFPLGSNWTIFVQGRWHYADDTLSGDFVDLGKLDLSGRELTGGFSWRF